MHPIGDEIDVNGTPQFQEPKNRFSMADHLRGIWFLALGLQIIPLAGTLLFRIPALQTVLMARVGSVAFGPFNFLLVVSLVTVCLYRKVGGARLAQWSIIAPVMLASYVGLTELLAAVRLASGLWSPLLWLIPRATASIGAMMASAYAMKGFVWGKHIPSGPINTRHLLGFVAAFGALLISVQPLHGLLIHVLGLGEAAEGLDAAFQRFHLIQAVYHCLNCVVIALAVLVMVLLILRKANSSQRMAGLAALGVWVVVAILTMHFGFGVLLLLLLRYGASVWAGFAAIFAGAVAVLYAEYVVGRQMRRVCCAGPSVKDKGR